MSNFLLWQLAYSELYFLKKLWPDFNKNDLIKIIKNLKSKKFWLSMISVNLKKILYIYFIIFLIILIASSNFFLVYSLIILGTLSIIEFITITKKISPNKLFLIPFNLFFIFIFLSFVFYFCFFQILFSLSCLSLSYSSLVLPQISEDLFLEKLLKVLN